METESKKDALKSKTRPVFHGQQKDGRFKIMKNGIRMLGSGIVCPFEHPNSRRRLRENQLETPDFDGRNRWIEIFCMRSMDGKTAYEFRGALSAVKNSATQEKMTVTQVNTSSARSPHAGKQRAASHAAIVTNITDRNAAQMPLNEHNATASIDTPVPKSKPNTTLEKDLVTELHLITAAYKNGAPVHVKKHHVSILTCESPQTIDRKVAGGSFPPPIKRGRSSFWPLAIVYAYLDGSWTELSDSLNK